MKKLLARIKNWISLFFIELKDDLIVATRKQWYVVVMAVVFIIATSNHKYWIGAIFALVFLVLLSWWALVKFNVVKTPEKK